MKRIEDIPDRIKDYESIYKKSSRAELGLRAVSVMYDEHSSDENSKKNIIILKENINYRLLSAIHQYLVLIRELRESEIYLEKQYKGNPALISMQIFGNPYFEKVEIELSSIFDNVIFQVSSIFDYLSLVICYICFNDKDKKLYWSQLAKASRGNDNEICKLAISKIIDKIDRDFVNRLYDYRSRLIHSKRDIHKFSYKATLHNFDFVIQALSSDMILKNFKMGNGGCEYTLTYMSSWLLKQSFLIIEEILEALVGEIQKKSVFRKNLITPKAKNQFMIVSFDPVSKGVIPVSDSLWEWYKTNKSSI